MPSKKRKKISVIDRLRRKHGGAWRYDNFNRTWTQHPSKLVVQAYAVPESTIDGLSDEVFYIEYRFTHNNELALP